MKNLSLAVLALLLLFSCTKPDENERIEGNCLVTKFIHNPDSSGQHLTLFYEYDNNRRVTRIYDNGNSAPLKFTYQGNRIIQEYSGEELRYYLGPDSMALYALSQSGAIKDSTVYLYTPEKYPWKIYRYRNGILTGDSTHYTITGTNITYVKIWQHGIANRPVAEMGYEPDLEKPSTSFAFQRNANLLYWWMPWLGKPNTHLIKKEVYGNQERIHQYTLNNAGYVTQIVSTDVTNGVTYYNFKTKMGYSCN